MSIRKSFVLVVVALLVSVTMTTAMAVTAASQADTPTPIGPPQPVDYSGVYVDLAGGYAKVRWSDSVLGAFNNFDTGVEGVVTEHKDGGITAGGDVGYQINRYFGIEGGWFYFPRVEGVSDVATNLPALILKSWAAYFALKIMAPIWGKLDVVGKLGISYRYLRYSDAASIVGGFGGQINHYWAAMFAAGLQYWLDQNWVTSVEYLHFPEYTQGGKVSRQAPTAHVIVASVGYKFTL